jgi:hypothetical protein
MHNHATVKESALAHFFLIPMACALVTTRFFDLLAIRKWAGRDFLLRIGFPVFLSMVKPGSLVL